MKRILLFLSVFCFLQAPGVKSQVLIGLLFGDKLNSEKLEFGFNLSGNFTTQSQVDNDSYGRGLVLGLYIDYKFAENFVLASSLLFKSPKGIKQFGAEEYFYSLPDTIWTNSSSARKLKYIELPLVVQYRPVPQFGVGLGIDLSLMTKVEDTFTHNVDDWDIVAKKSVTNFFNRFDVALAAGLNYHFKGNPGVQIRLNYYLGLINVYKESTNRTGYNRTIQLGAMIPIKTGVKKKDK